MPHVPPTALGFWHVPLEIYGNAETGLDYSPCNGSGEDPTCADQWSFFHWSIADHLTYIDVPVGSGHC